MMQNVTDQQVGEWVRARRATLKLGVKRACDLAGISRTAWYDLEAGRHPPSTDTQAGVARALAVDRDWHDRLRAGDQPVESPTTEVDVLTRLAALERWQAATTIELQELADGLAELAEMSHQHAGRRRGEATASGR